MGAEAEEILEAVEDSVDFDDLGGCPVDGYCADCGRAYSVFSAPPSARERGVCWECAGRIDGYRPMTMRLEVKKNKIN